MKRQELIKRLVFVELACDGDYRTLSSGRSLAARLTIAQALEASEAK